MKHYKKFESIVNGLNSKEVEVFIILSLASHSSLLFLFIPDFYKKIKFEDFLVLFFRPQFHFLIVVLLTF